MKTAQSLGTKAEEALVHYLMNPVHARMHYPGSSKLNPNLTIGTTLMVPTMEGEHESIWEFLDANHETEWTSKILVSGYWHVHFLERLYYKDVQDAPVWTMSTVGATNDSFIGDLPASKELFHFMMRASKPQFERRKRGERKFYPRGVECHEQDAWKYECEWTGDYRAFRGTETVTQEGVIAWTASFHGGTLLSRGLRVVT